MTVSTHGTEGGYRRGCRCQECRDAVAVARRRQREARRPERPGVPPRGTDHRWQDRAACADIPNTVFFPVTANYERAKQVCAGCDVRFQCLSYAITTAQPEGVWGGLSPVERRGLFRRRRAVS